MVNYQIGHSLPAAICGLLLLTLDDRMSCDGRVDMQWAAQLYSCAAHMCAVRLQAADVANLVAACLALMQVGGTVGSSLAMCCRNSVDNCCFQITRCEAALLPNLSGHVTGC